MRTNEMHAGDALEERPSPHAHGGPRDAELRALGIDVRELVDFSVNTNPYGARLLEDRAYLLRGLRALGLRAFDSSAPFCVVQVGDARALRQRLLVGHRILVRDCASFGLPEHVRLAVRPERDSARLIAALRREQRR